MSKPNPLLMQAVREAADSLADALQVVILEGERLAREGCGGEEGKERVARLVNSARTAVDLCRSLFGVSDRAASEHSGELKTERRDDP